MYYKQPFSSAFGSSQNHTPGTFKLSAPLTSGYPAKQAPPARETFSREDFKPETKRGSLTFKRPTRPTQEEDLLELNLTQLESYSREATQLARAPTQASTPDNFLGGISGANKQRVSILLILNELGSEKFWTEQTGQSAVRGFSGVHAYCGL